MLSHVRYEFKNIDKEAFFKLVFKAGLGKVRHILHDVEVLDWDMHCWIVEMNNGEIKALTLYDVRFREVSLDNLVAALNQTKMNLQSLELAVESMTAASVIKTIDAT
jgi:hypothetical protein